MIVTAYYNAGNLEIITGYTVSPSIIESGIIYVTVSYMEKTDITSINVIENPSSSEIRVSKVNGPAGSVATVPFYAKSTLFLSSGMFTMPSAIFYIKFR